jgi:hypothetical protein
MAALRGSHWISDEDEDDDEHTVTVDLVSDLVLDDVIHPRGAITFHRDDSPSAYVTMTWDNFMRSYLIYA